MARPGRPQSPVRISSEDLHSSVEALVERGELDLAARTLELALEAGGTVDEQQRWLTALCLVPEQTRLYSSRWALLTVRLLGNTRQPAEVLRFCTLIRANGDIQGFEAVFAFAAWAYVRLNEYEAALAEVGRIKAGLTGLPLGIALRSRAEALARLEHPNWRTAFEQARRHLSGRALGTCWLEEGVYLEGAGDDLRALHAWREALRELGEDRYYAAWLRHNIGLSCLRLGLPEAEDHFAELGRLARSGEVKAFRARAACGVAAVRRLRGEFAQAAALYREAVRQAREADDQQQAWWGLGLTQRLEGKPGLALESLGKAVACGAGALSEAGCSPVFVDVAAAHLALRDVGAARAALDRTGPLAGQDRDRATVLRAELAWRAGDTAEARSALRGVRTTLSGVREEAGVFPDVFKLLPPAERPVQLTRLPGTRIEVRAIGALSVRVNGRAVRLPATGRAGELLVALLEHGNRATTRQLAFVLYPEENDERRGGKAVWAQVRALRRALGWEGSVCFSEGVYLLDETAQWWYDVREAMVRGEPIPAFLSGIDSNWVQDRVQELSQRGGPYKR